MRTLTILNALLLVSGSYAWKWAKKGKASVTRYGSMGILSCNCKVSAMEVGPACAINENAYGGYDGLGSGVACGMCYKLTPYGSPETDQWPKSPEDLPEPMVFKVTDICPHNANPAWCPSQESSPKNSVGMEYHFDINVDSWQPETLIKWFGNGSLGTMLAEFELVSCEEWIGWSKKGQFEDSASQWWGCCPANPGLEKDTVCGYPAENKAPAPQESDRIKPADFPFIGSSGSGSGSGSGSVDVPTTTSSTSQTSSTSTKKCKPVDGFKCCESTCKLEYIDDHYWGVENGDWCVIDEGKCNCPVEIMSQGYSCCENTCKVEYTDDYKWGYENGDWCGIKSTC